MPIFFTSSLSLFFPVLFFFFFLIVAVVMGVGFLLMVSIGVYDAMVYNKKYIYGLHPYFCPRLQRLGTPLPIRTMGDLLLWHVVSCLQFLYFLQGLKDEMGALFINSPFLSQLCVGEWSDFWKSPMTGRLVVKVVNHRIGGLDLTVPPFDLLEGEED